jgi:HPt (histidine-containing phosphotransfer) domain-containing protein
MDAYVSKPIKATELFAAIAGLQPRRPAASEVAVSTEAIFDMEAGLQNVGGDRELLELAVRDYYGDRVSILEQMDVALAHADAKAMRALAHRLKGGLAALGAHQAAGTAATLEERSGAADLATARLTVETLKLQLTLLESHLEPFLREAA